MEITTPAVQLDGLGKDFRTRAGTVTAVDRVDLTIGRGEVVALLGPNGAGKTTTLDMLLGLAEPTRGRARVLGQAPRRAVAQGRLSAVLQTGGLLSDLTVRETVRYVAATYGGRALPVDEALHRAGLTELRDRRVVRCSGGEQQRLRFALALLPEPDLLVLDEPTAGMDVSARREFWAAMHSEAARGRTVVFATHYLEEADDFADRIVLMAGGRVVADGPTAEIRATATGRVVSAVVPDPGAARSALAGLASEITLSAGRLEVRTGDSDRVARLLLGELGGRDLEIAAGSLEDAFVHITTRPGPAAPVPETAGAAR